MPKRSLERILQSLGFGTKKHCRQLVRRGRVRVTGALATDPFEERLLEGLEIEVDVGGVRRRHAFGRVFALFLCGTQRRRVSEPREAIVEHGDTDHCVQT